MMAGKVRFFMPLLWAALVLFPSLPQSEEGKVTLSYQWKAGEVLKYKIEQKLSTVTGVLPLGTQTLKTTLNLSLLQNLGGGRCLLEGTFDGFWVNAASDLVGNWTVDTKKDLPPDSSSREQITHTVFKVLSGLKLRILLASDGRVESVEGFDGVVEKMIEEAPEELRASWRSARPSLEESYNADFFYSLFPFPSFPGGGVGKGDKWEYSFETSQQAMGRISHRVHCLAEELSKREAVKVSLRGRLTLKEVSQALQAILSSFRKNGSEDLRSIDAIALKEGESKGALDFDGKAGRINALTYEWTLRGEFMDRELIFTNSLKALLWKEAPAPKQEKPPKKQ